MTNPLDHQEAQDWIAAGARHGFRVEAPFELTVDSRSVRFVAFLPNFGGPNGMVVEVGSSWQDAAERAQLAKSNGLYYSLVGGYGLPRDNQLLRDTLDDWRYYGPDEHRPGWYTGKPWG